MQINQSKQVTEMISGKFSEILNNGTREHLNWNIT